MTRETETDDQHLSHSWIIVTMTSMQGGRKKKVLWLSNIAVTVDVIIGFDSCSRGYISDLLWWLF